MDKLKVSFKNSSLGLTDEDVKAAEAKKGSGSRFMDPGIHSCKIVEADFYYKKDSTSCMSDKDPTWAIVKIVFENAAKAQKMHFLMIPTSSLLFAPGVQKRPEFAFLAFKKFCASIGIEVSADAKILTQVMTKYFADPKKLIGMTCDIEIGYKGPYVQYISKEEYKLCLADGTDLVPEIFATKKEAQLKAVELKKTLVDFSEILDFLGKAVPSVKKEEEADNEMSEIQADW